MFPTNPDRAIILGMMDLDFENLFWVSFSKFPDVHVPRLQNLQTWPGLGQVLGQACVGPGSGLALVGVSFMTLLCSKLSSR